MRSILGIAGAVLIIAGFVLSGTFRKGSSVPLGCAPLILGLIALSAFAIATMMQPT